MSSSVCGPETLSYASTINEEDTLKTYVYHIEHPGEYAAGIRAFTDTVTIAVDSGEPGGDEEGEYSFHEFMLQALKEWYDGAHVREEV